MSDWLTKEDVENCFPLLHDSAEWESFTTAILDGAMAIIDGELYDKGGVLSLPEPLRREIKYAGALLALAGVNGEEMPWKRAWQLIKRVRYRTGSTGQVAGSSQQVYGPNDFVRWERGLDRTPQEQGDSAVAFG